MAYGLLNDYLLGQTIDAYKYFGAHLKKNENGEEGVEFVVYAPQAKRINVIGTFNSWSILGSEMEKVDYRGLFKLFQYARRRLCREKLWL